MSREKPPRVTDQDDNVDPRALMSLIEYVVAEAQQLSPVAAMLLTLARRELLVTMAICDGTIARHQRWGA